MTATRFIALALLALAPTVAMAHPGHGEAVGLAFGFMHPLSGLDHILAMVAVGLFAARLGGRACWLLPLSFVTAMVTGACLGFSGVSLPLVEQGIALSVIVLGVAIAAGLKLPTPAGMALVAAFAVFHGHAHGSEGAASEAFALYAAGFVAATLALHMVGVTLGLAFGRLGDARARTLYRAGAVAGAVAGIGLLLA